MTDQEIIRSFKNKLDEISDRQMIQILEDRSLKSFSYIAKLLGYKHTHKEKYVASYHRPTYVYDVESLQADCINGMSVADMAKKYKVPKNVVTTRKHELVVNGVNLPDRRKKAPHATVIA